MFSSLIAPNINSASGSTSALILLTDWSTSNKVRSFPPVILINKPFAPWREYSSIKGLFKAISVAAIALFSPSASPVPIIALPMALITVSTSAKSRFIIPGLTIKSVTLCTPCFKTLFDKLNDSSNVVVSLAILKRFWFGTTITVSKCFLNSSRPSIALLILFGPSYEKGNVVTPTVKMFNSLAALAITCDAPVPVPPPMPDVIKTIFAPCIKLVISFIDSSAAAWPISCLAPAPSPFVKFMPIWIFAWALLIFKSCASVFTATNSTPSIPASIIALIAFPPAPPTPKTNILGFNSLSSPPPIFILMTVLPFV